MLVTPRHLEILQHALGLDKHGLCENYRNGRRHYDFSPHRNHFCAGGDDEVLCRELVSIGYMHTWPGADDAGRVPGYPYFNCSVTEAGKEAVRRESPAPPKRTRSQERYRDYLDADSGMRFGEWLKNSC